MCYCQVVQHIYIRNIYPLSLLNWLLKATEAREDSLGEVYSTLGLLYNIGCTLQKGIVKVSILFD